MMNLDEFAALVRQMRAAQKDYFRSRRDSALQRSKELEKAVDAALEQIAAGPTMFEADEEPPPRCRRCRRQGIGCACGYCGRCCELCCKGAICPCNEAVK